MHDQQDSDPFPSSLLSPGHQAAPRHHQRSRIRRLPAASAAAQPLRCCCCASTTGRSSAACCRRRRGNRTLRARRLLVAAAHPPACFYLRSRPRRAAPPASCSKPIAVLPAAFAARKRLVRCDAAPPSPAPTACAILVALTSVQEPGRCLCRLRRRPPPPHLLPRRRLRRRQHSVQLTAKPLDLSVLSRCQRAHFGGVDERF